MNVPLVPTKVPRGMCCCYTFYIITNGYVSSAQVPPPPKRKAMRCEKYIYEAIDKVHKSCNMISLDII